MATDQPLSTVINEIRRQISDAPNPTIAPDGWGWRAGEALFRVTDRLPDPAGDAQQLQNRGVYVTIAETDTISAERDRDETLVHDQVAVTLCLRVIPAHQGKSELDFYDLEDLLRRRLCDMSWRLGRDMHIRFVASRRARAQQSAEWLVCTQTFQITRYITLD
jgi:hypothetical protein